MTSVESRKRTRLGVVMLELLSNLHKFTNPSRALSLLGWARHGGLVETAPHTSPSQELPALNPFPFLHDSANESDGLVDLNLKSVLKTYRTFWAISR